MDVDEKVDVRGETTLQSLIVGIVFRSSSFGALRPKLASLLLLFSYASLHYC